MSVLRLLLRGRHRPRSMAALRWLCLPRRLHRWSRDLRPLCQPRLGLRGTLGLLRRRPWLGGLTSWRSRPRLLVRRWVLPGRLCLLLPGLPLPHRTGMSGTRWTMDLPRARPLWLQVRLPLFRRRVLPLWMRTTPLAPPQLPVAAAGIGPVLWTQRPPKSFLQAVILRPGPLWTATRRVARARPTGGTAMRSASSRGGRLV